jgi:hypothetical protein
MPSNLPISCSAKQLSKVKRFLTTLIQFACDISPEIGDQVKYKMLNLVVRSLVCFNP